MKRIISIVIALAMVHMGFSQTSSVEKTDKQAQMGASGAHFVKANPGYLKGRGPVNNPQKPAATVAQSNVKPTATIASAEPKMVATQNPQTTQANNEQRIVKLNARLAENKAREEAKAANAQRPSTSAPATINTLKTPAGLKSSRSLNTTPSNTVNTTRQINR